MQLRKVGYYREVSCSMGNTSLTSWPRKVCWGGSETSGALGWLWQPLTLTPLFPVFLLTCSKYSWSLVSTRLIPCSRDFSHEPLVECFPGNIELLCQGMQTQTFSSVPRLGLLLALGHCFLHVLLRPLIQPLMLV